MSRARPPHFVSPLCLAALWAGLAAAPACSSAPANAKPAPTHEAPAPAPAPADPDPGVIDTAGAKRAIAGGALVVDVRTQREFEAGALPEASLIPFDEIGGRLDELRTKLGDDATRTVVVYCRSGRRSGIAARELSAAGFTVINGGGLRAMQAP